MWNDLPTDKQLRAITRLAMAAHVADHVEERVTDRRQASSEICHLRELLKIENRRKRYEMQNVNMVCLPVVRDVQKVLAGGMGKTS